ncbi:hypothetical protein [Micromonospora sp. WMMD708]|uniref:hypothetical protein n=1 Tax=Micromonospora sp. WMMD708 TaxID=3403464 RepID=UPI003BF47A94
MDRREATASPPEDRPADPVAAPSTSLEEAGPAPESGGPVATESGTPRPGPNFLVRHQGLFNLAMVIATTIVTGWGFYYARAAYFMADAQEQRRNASEVAVWTIRKDNPLNPYGTDAIQIQNRSSSTAASVSLVSWSDARTLAWRVEDGNTTIDAYGAWPVDDLGGCTSLVLQHPDPENRRIGLIFIQDGRTWLIIAGQPLTPLGQGDYEIRNTMTSVAVRVSITIPGKDGKLPTTSPEPPADGQWHDSSC